MNTFLKFFTWAFIVLLPVVVEAQEVRVLSEALEFDGAIGASQRKTIILQNEGNTSKTYFLKNINGNIGSSQDMKICIGENCFDAKRDLAKIKVTLEPGEIVTDLYLEFSLGITETRGGFDLVFVNEKNIRESFIVEAKYDVINPEERADESDYDAIRISDVYPNPSNRIAQLDYVLKKPQANAKITINSFIGNPVAEFVLDPDQNTLVINVSDFHPGVYFYTLFVDNKNIVTKKLVVKK
ncbi:T9SS type A sorting domain-containing protein [Algoriphagus kandeliae]|uniref:T9SS type A sorting domain-containing protein n=1 Tax=Algoriphagus kandeliae TaxID=2562278 RepID=A0A4Y9QR65_9BACT|nr:T9SS type A sorting domain-containing protein [Algoriphagus kandeliae]TFV93355.1 T9SS type A sorting domain-containing protein [Algoriphagus kandeliae]